MNETSHYARRYHWLSEKVSDFVNEPHAAVLCETRRQALNLVAWNRRQRAALLPK